MSKFKVGDKVRRIANGCSWCPVGTEVEVIGFEDYDNSCLPHVVYIDLWGDTSRTRTSDFELVTPSIPSPIVTETVTRVVPDQYGIVSIKENHPRYEKSVNVCIQPTHATAEQLRHAASTLTALADHLESQKP